MQVKSILIAALCFLPVLTTCASAADDTVSATGIPELPYSFEVPWDISKDDNLLVQDFVVNRREPITLFHLLFAPIDQFKTKMRTYSISIDFKVIRPPLSSEDSKELKDLLGEYPYHYYTNDPVHPVLVPTHTPEEEQQAMKLVYKGIYQIKHDIPGTMIPVSVKIEKIDDDSIVPIIPEKIINTTGSGGYGNYRFIAIETLSPGKYRISAYALRKIKLPPNIKTFLSFGSGGSD